MKVIFLLFVFDLFILFYFVLKQLQSLKEKWEKSKIEAISDTEQTLAELNRRHERDKQILAEDNVKLSSNVQFVSFIFVSRRFRYSNILLIDESCLQLTESMNRLQSERANLESEYESLRAKQDALGQWETQLSEIIQWVSDEKDARAYLQALATKMTEELDYLKHAGKDLILSTVDLFCSFLSRFFQGLGVADTRSGSLIH